MDFSSIMRALRRRWYLVVLGIAATAGLAVGVAYIVPLTFDAKASFVLLPPPPAEQQPGTSPLHDNPYLRLGGLEIMGGVLGISLNDSSTYLTVIPARSPDKYLVADDPSVPGAVLEITATAESPERAFEIMDSVLAIAESRLADLQVTVGAPPDSQVRMAVITDNTVAEPNTSTLIRLLIIVIAGGVVLTVLFALSVDALVRRRREKRAARGPAARRGRKRSREPTAPGYEDDSDVDVDDFRSETITTAHR